MRRYEDGKLVGEPEVLNTFPEWLDNMVRTMENIHANQEDETADLFISGRLSMIHSVALAWSRRQG